ncbi:MAG: DUF2283 domain-containing protein [Verrucomicrobia bacterium]|nr:DUF2283 domain-containing protein [Verrucomicrobiota bacterium]
MKTGQYIITLKSKTPPVVELDSAEMAAYVRFSRRKVLRTEVLDSRKSTVTVDFDSTGDVIGIELVGVKEFTLSRLLEDSGIALKPHRPDTLRRARYIRTGSALRV